jgi:hypothetical protein
MIRLCFRGVTPKERINCRQEKLAKEEQISCGIRNLCMSESTINKILKAKHLESIFAAFLDKNNILEITN